MAVPQLDQKDELDCCGGVFFAEVRRGSVVMECSKCGSLWFQQMSPAKSWLRRAPEPGGLFPHSISSTAYFHRKRIPSSAPRTGTPGFVLGGSDHTAGDQRNGTA